MMTDTNEISKAFHRHALEYERSAKVQLEIGKRLFARLQYLKIAPKRILDLGCGPGSFLPDLAALYSGAQVIGLDLVPAMLKQAEKKQGWRRKWSVVAADMIEMPFPDHAFDLIFANQVIHWGNPLQEVMRELNRVLQVGGCLMFSTLGPYTFSELKTAWSTVNHYAHANDFIDMHDLGDILIKEYFADPVIDMEMLNVHYESLQQLVDALQQQGVRNINPRRNQGLTGKNAWQQFNHNYDRLKTAEGKYPLSYEVVYGHAWKGLKRKTASGTESFISVSDIRKR